MENGAKPWVFRGTQKFTTKQYSNDSKQMITIREAQEELVGNLNQDDERSFVHLGHGDPSAYPCFRTTPSAEDAIVSALRSAQFNCYPPAAGIPPARRAIAEYVSRDLPYKLSPDDVYVTAGGNQSIEIIITALARSGVNILLPRPGYPQYEARAAFSHLEVRHFDLIPEKGWEVDLDAVEALADENTVAIVIINPGNPCGNVFSYQHLKKVAETARKLGMFVIADEVYSHIVFGNKPFIPMGEFGSIVPVLTIGSISKRWIVPGWRLGWIVTNDPCGLLKQTGILDSIRNYVNLSSDPVTFIQGAIPEILGNTEEDFFSNIVRTIKEDADICCSKIKEIPCIVCPQQPEGAMSVMVKLNLSLLEGINDDMDFCVKLVKEESVIVLPGTTVGMKNWIRITFAIEPAILAEGLDRIKSFYQRHAKKL
ncbi:nicotianamine aminotransferase 1-like [Pistacia vera]|uniref:nicotianamine aminotransferase 1-like n=1 Tax=Pistacia vera TaxID=55513 RepID=UPI001263D3C2|nr:nicotianamine aminotransferase 1-like [Pistacia vera]XP_031250361.1 nicotianamine aminotransferase 1-like [Pistacia vera]